MEKQFFKFRTFLLTLMVSVFSLGFVSCGGDDDPVEQYSSYYISCTKANGGGMDSQEISMFVSELNQELVAYTLSGATKSEALEWFDKEMKDLAKSLSDLKPEQDLEITFALNTTEGIRIKTSTIVFTKKGSSIK